MTVVLDSSAWVELLADAGRAHHFEPALRAQKLCVPAVVRYEVLRYTLAHGSQQDFKAAAAALGKFQGANIDAAVADKAAVLAHRHKLSAADAVIYATAQEHGAELWTQDSHFKGLPGVKFFPKP